jgi:multiple sugar transport system substrate-binding protein
VNKGTMGIGLDDGAAQKVAAYWEPLIKDGIVSTAPDYTTAWYNGLATGEYATWLTAAWGPLFLSEEAASSTGKWRVAPLPQWTSGASVSGNNGGSTTAVTAQTASPAAAAEFAMFINTNPACAKLFSEPPQYLFPTLKSVLASSSFLDGALPFYGGQQVNREFASISTTVDTGFTWSPFEDEINTSFTDTVGAVMADRGDLLGAISTWQSTVTRYATGEGIKVS